MFVIVPAVKSLFARSKVAPAFTVIIPFLGFPPYVVFKSRSTESFGYLSLAATAIITVEPFVGLAFTFQFAGVFQSVLSAGETAAPVQV